MQGGGMRVSPVAGNALYWVNVDRQGRPDPQAMHMAEAVKDKKKKGGGTGPNTTTSSSSGEMAKGEMSGSGSAVKYGINVWVRGEEWNTWPATFRLVLKRWVNALAPSTVAGLLGLTPDELAEIYCPQCGAYIHREADWITPAVHLPRCPIHRR